MIELTPSGGDDFPQLQQALNGADPVICLKGWGSLNTFTVSKPLSATKAVHLAGMTPSLTVVSQSPAGLTFIAPSIEHWLRLSDFEWQTQGADGIAVDAQWPSYPSWPAPTFDARNMAFTPWNAGLGSMGWKQAVKLTDAWAARFTGCFFRGDDDRFRMVNAVWLTGKTVNTILEHCHVAGAKRRGAQDGIQVGAAIYADGIGCEGTIVRGATILGAAAGIATNFAVPQPGLWVETLNADVDNFAVYAVNTAQAFISDVDALSHPGAPIQAFYAIYIGPGSHFAKVARVHVVNVAQYPSCDGVVIEGPIGATVFDVTQEGGENAVWLKPGTTSADVDTVKARNVTGAPVFNQAGLTNVYRSARMIH